MLPFLLQTEPYIDRLRATYLLMARTYDCLIYTLQEIQVLLRGQVAAFNGTWPFIFSRYLELQV